MARYCFYCGRELEDQEKCDCRNRFGTADAGRQQASGPDPAPSGSTRQNQSTSRQETGSWQHREDPANYRKKQAKKTKKRSNPYVHYGQAKAGRTQRLQSLLSFFATPADAMARELSPVWSTSHTAWLSVTLVLSGLHYMTLNRSLSKLLTGGGTEHSLGETLLGWLTGSALVALILLLFSLTLWLLARFLYRQGGLPFVHAIAAGRSSWKYLTLFLLLALPSLFTGGAVYGLVLTLMGLVFAVLVHARQLARLTHLDDNRAWQLAYLSIIIFAGILSSVTSLVQALNLLQ